MISKSMLRLTLAAAVLLPTAGCRGSSTGITGVDTTTIVPAPVAATFDAIPMDGQDLRVVYTDGASLVLADVTLTPERGAVPTGLDRPPAPTTRTGKIQGLTYARIDEVDYLARLDGEGDGAVLDVLTRARPEEPWVIYNVAPAGLPLGFLAADGEVRLLVSNEDGVSTAGVTSSVRWEHRTVARDVTPGGPVCVVSRESGDAATFFDTVTGHMHLVEWSAAGYGSVELDPPQSGAFGRVHHTRVDATGKLCVFYLDPTTNGLVDLRDVGGSPRQVGLTTARDVTTLEARSEGEATYYVWAGAATGAAGGGGARTSLSILRNLGGKAAYLFEFGSVEAPYGHVRMLRTPQEILVLASGEGITLYRLALPAR